MTTSEFYGPNSTSVVVDKGTTGIRGNNIFVSQGEPNSNLSGNFIHGDLAIDISTSSPTYLFIYRYESRVISGNSVDAWYLNLIENSAQSIIRLIPNSISLNEEVLFVDGSATVSVQLPIPPGIEITGDIADRIDIQHSIADYTEDINFTPQEADIFDQFLAQENVEYDGGDSYFGEDPGFFDEILDGGSEPDLLPSASIPEAAINSPISSFFTTDNANIAQGVINLDITFNSIFYFGNNWSPLQGDKTIHLVITVV